MNIPIADLKRQLEPIRRQIEEAVEAVLDSADFVSGQEVANFEKEIAAYLSAEFAVGVSNGTDALRLALVACGIKPGDGVVCPSFTYYATAGAISSIGARPVFCDIHPDTYNISAKSVEQVLKKEQKLKLSAVIPVHLYGQCADMDGIMSIAKQYKLKVIEDNAQAFGAEYRGRKAGTIGDCGAVSFYPGKNLGACGDAGLVVTRDKEIRDRLCLLRNQGNSQKYYHSMLGFNHRLDTIQAAILRVKLKYLNSWNEKRRQNAAFFNNELGRLGLKTPFLADYSTHIYHLYVLRLEGESSALIAHLRKNGVDARVYYPVPLHLQECFRHLGYKKGDFPESESASTMTLAIPVYPELTMQELGFIVNSIKEFFK